MTKVNPESNTIITINGIAYRLVPCAEESQPLTYTIDEIKQRKIAVRCENNAEANKMVDAIGGDERDRDLLICSYPISVFAKDDRDIWDAGDVNSEWLKDNGLDAIIPFSQVVFPNQDKPVMEKDWEIVAITNALGDLIKYKDGICIGRSDNAVTVSGTMSLEEAIKNLHRIHTVRRTSDNTEWSVGDKIEWGAIGSHTTEIKCFELREHGLRVITTDGITLLLRELSKPVKKAALFVSADGENIFEGDEYFFVTMVEPARAQRFIASNEQYDNPHRFKHRANAEAYVKKNKPAYSEQQIEDACSETYANETPQTVVNRILSKLGITQ